MTTALIYLVHGTPSGTIVISVLQKLICNNCLDGTRLPYRVITAALRQATIGEHRSGQCNNTLMSAGEVRNGIIMGTALHKTLHTRRIQSSAELSLCNYITNSKVLRVKRSARGPQHHDLPGQTGMNTPHSSENIKHVHYFKANWVRPLAAK